MGLFGFGKKKEEKTESKCSCGSCQTPVAKGAEIEGDIKRIRVLGSGCKNCHTLLENTKEAVKNMGMNTEVAEIARLGVMSTPALMVNDSIVSSGRVLKASDVEKLLEK